jgi:hypothetical protein
MRRRHTEHIVGMQRDQGLPVPGIDRLQEAEDDLRLGVLLSAQWPLERGGDQTETHVDLEGRGQHKGKNRLFLGGRQRQKRQQRESGTGGGDCSQNLPLTCGRVVQSLKSVRKLLARTFGSKSSPR